MFNLEYDENNIPDISTLKAKSYDNINPDEVAPVKRIGVEDTYGHSGPALGLLAEFGLDAEGLEKRIIEIVK